MQGGAVRAPVRLLFDMNGRPPQGAGATASDVRSAPLTLPPARPPHRAAQAGMDSSADSAAAEARRQPAVGAVFVSWWPPPAAATPPSTITRARAARPHDLWLEVSHMSPSNRPSPVVAQAGCTYQLRSLMRVRPSFSWISCGFIAGTGTTAGSPVGVGGRGSNQPAHREQCGSVGSISRLFLVWCFTRTNGICP